jgi:N utilization substance protein B
MTYAQGWDMDRLPAVDRNILRIGIFEILWSTSVPTSVSIDEALNLARELSSDDSSKYIHGVLARIASLKDSISI